jgi:hypothetical protein
MRVPRVRLFRVRWWMVLAVAFAALVVGIVAWEARARRDGWYNEWHRADSMERHCISMVHQAERAVSPSVMPSNVASSEITITRADVIEHYMEQAKWYASRMKRAERELRRLGYRPPIRTIPIDEVAPDPSTP